MADKSKPKILKKKRRG